MARVPQGASPQEHTTRGPCDTFLQDLKSLVGDEEEEDDHPIVGTIPPLDELRTSIAYHAFEFDKRLDRLRPLPDEDSEHPQQ